MNEDEAWQYLKEQAKGLRVFRVIPRKEFGGPAIGDTFDTFRFEFYSEEGTTRIETYCIKKLAALVKAVIEGGAA